MHAAAISEFVRVRIVPVASGRLGFLGTLPPGPLSSYDLSPSWEDDSHQKAVLVN